MGRDKWLKPTINKASIFKLRAKKLNVDLILIVSATNKNGRYSFSAHCYFYLCYKSNLAPFYDIICNLPINESFDNISDHLVL